ncbi:MAG TPA: hypothetical protein VJ768_11880, partial [Anaerolineales bacterium]|nr:hypothetical protein [Anaerolineales bacterium]
GNPVIDQATLLKVVPIFVAVMVWLSRILIIGTFSVAGKRLFSQSDRPALHSPVSRPRSAPAQAPYSPAPKPAPASQLSTPVRPEPSYHPVSMAGRSRNGEGAERS